jgi:hypothetical protein
MKGLILLLTIAAAAAAGPITLIPQDGTIAGLAGSTVGWGFQLPADAVNWISITGVVTLGEDNPALGVFTDFISPQGGPDFGALAPAGPAWEQNFDAANFQGFGSYTIDPGAIAGDHNSGTFLVLYETFTDNPATCGSCFDSSGTAFLDFRVDVVAAPEPGTALLAGLALGIAGFRCARR